MPEFKVSFWAVDKEAPKWEKARPVMMKVDAPRAEDVAAVLGKRWDKIKGLKVNPGDYSIYEALAKVMAPNEIDHHESDLYVLRNEKSQPIVEAYVGSARMFTSNVDHKLWYDLPFAYQPFWEKKGVRMSAVAQVQPVLTPPAPGHFGWKKKKSPRLTR